MKLKRYGVLVICFFCLLGSGSFVYADDGWEELENWARSRQAEERPPAEREIPRLSDTPPRTIETPEAPLTPVLETARRAPETRIVRPTIISSPPPSREQTDRPSHATTPSGARVSPRAAQVQRPAAPTPQPPERNYFAEHFFMTPDQKLLYQTSEVGGFIFVEERGPGGIPEYSVVTDFGGNVVRTQHLHGVHDLQEARKWVRDNLETSTFEGVEVRKLSVPVARDRARDYYWVGHKAFDIPDRAFAEIAMNQAAVEAAGGDFPRMVREAQTYVVFPEEKPPVEIASADFEKEERLFLKMFDALDVGNKMLGPFTGEASGEPIIWQSFGEMSWRRTNLESLDYSEVTGFWSNRVVFKGIRAPFSTIDPFLEATLAMESDGVDFKDTMKLWAGLEWRPFSMNPWLYNYRPWGLPLLEWIRNYRFYVMYGDRINLKDEIEGSASHDLHAGVQIFYEFGIDLPGAGEGAPSTFTDYLRHYVWGEYFGNYRYERTGFSAVEGFGAIILNSNVVLGFRLPGIPLPPNPINDELVLMPYMRFEHVNNTSYSFPFQNYHFVAAGVRWMPFRTYQYKENEWLSKVKIFGEYVGIGKVHHADREGDEDLFRYDLRFGVNISSRRF